MIPIIKTFIERRATEEEAAAVEWWINLARQRQCLACLAKAVARCPRRTTRPAAGPASLRRPRWFVLCNVTLRITYAVAYAGGGTATEDCGTIQVSASRRVLMIHHFEAIGTCCDNLANRTVLFMAGYSGAWGHNPYYALK